jgi:hypothetical protein
MSSFLGLQQRNAQTRLFERNLLQPIKELGLLASAFV